MRSEESIAKTGSALWALLVGIDKYHANSVSNLRGCVNDVEAMQVFLSNQLDISDDHIRLLTNQQATRKAILRTFEEFLIDNPSITFNDQILIHYSGHGSQMPDTTGVEPDGYNETIVPHDSRTPGIYDIPDKTLAALLARLSEKKGKNITVILDSCHSGSGTRRIDLPNAPRIRLAPIDNRLPPADLDIDLLAASSTRGAGPSGWVTASTSHVLLAGCRDRELSNEYWAKNEGQEGVWHGALTHFTLQALRQMAPGITYAELHERVAAQVKAIYRDQTPQCEGNRDRVVFEGLQVQREPFISIQQVEGNIVTLGAGLVHGLRRGSELALYPSETRTRQNLPTVPLATVTVTEVTATNARSQVNSETNQAIPLHARALITKQVYTGMSQTLALYAEEGEENQLAIDHLREAIQKATPDGKPSPYLEVVSDHQAAAELCVVASAGKLQIYNSNGVLLVEPADIDVLSQSTTTSVLHALENVVRYRTILALKNEEQISQLAGKIKLRLRRHMAGQLVSQAQELHIEAVGLEGELTVYFYADQPDRNLYVVDVINESPLNIYPHVFTLSPDYSIQRLYPRQGEQEAVKPNFTFAIPDRLSFFLPPGWDVSRDYLKVIVTTVPTDLQVLEQQGLTVPLPSREGGRAGKEAQSYLSQLLDSVLSNTRFVGLAASSIGEDWTAVELPITTMRAFEAVKPDVSLGEVPLSDGPAIL